MNNQQVSEISPSEWELMRIVWTLGEVTSPRLIELIQRKRNWSESTVKTLLGRLVKKGLLTTDRSQRPFVYQPLVSEKVAMDDSMTTLFDHLCAMKRGQSLADVIRNLELSRSDIEQLQAVLADKLATAPETVPCDCLPADVK